jgi:hypothetical protein
MDCQLSFDGVGLTPARGITTFFTYQFEHGQSTNRGEIFRQVGSQVTSARTGTHEKVPVFSFYEPEGKAPIVWF